MADIYQQQMLEVHARVQDISLRSWSQNLVLNTLKSQDTFYGDPGMGPPLYDWPVPKGYRRMVDIHNHTYRPSIEMLYPPFFQTSWPVPPGPRRASTLNTH